MAVNDPTLALMASRMSCDAMSDLSKNHYIVNLDNHMHALTQPPCELAFGFADSRQEHLLQKGATIPRNVCIEKLPAFQRGPWESQIKPGQIQQPVFFLQSTRTRFNASCDQRSKNDCDCRLQRERFI
jgi:hypothetical protein